MRNKESLMTSELPEIVTPRFVLILGPSGVGKSTLIGNLHEADHRIQFVSPITDRQNRPGETEKICVNPETFSELERNNFFLLVNEVYGNRYGTPRSSIDEILAENKIPILDFPLKDIHKLNEYKSILYNIYLVPPTLGTLHTRIDNDNRGVDNMRYADGKAELLELVNSHFQHPDINEVIINRDLKQSTSQVLNLIYNAITK